MIQKDCISVQSFWIIKGIIKAVYENPKYGAIINRNT